MQPGSCSGMALEIVQRCQAPNEAWRNLEIHYRAKGTREILRLSHEINGKTMEPGSDPFKFMMEVDKLAGDLHRLGDKSVTELRKCVIIVSGLSADFEIECRMLENNPDGLNRGEIERVVGNQYNRLLKQQQDSKALSASRGTVTANRENGKNRRLCNKFEGKCFNCGKKGHRAVDCRSTKKKSEKSGAAVERKEGGGGGRCYVCESVEHLAHKHCRLCRSLEHRTRDCEERGAEKGAMLAKLTAPAVPEVRAAAAMVGTARSDEKEEWESDSGATFHMSHTRAGMSDYKKASPGTNIEIADGNTLPVDGFGRIEVDLDQPGRTTKMVRMDDVAYVPGLSRNLVSTVKAVKQWGKPLIYYRDRAVLGLPGEESLVFKFCPRRGLFSVTGTRRIPRQETFLEANLTGNGSVKIASGAALKAAASHDVMEVHRMLAHPSEVITRKTAAMMGIETTGQWRACETCFQVKAKRHAVPKKTDERASVRTSKIVERQAVQWVDGPRKTGSDGTGSDDRGMKSAGNGTIVERGIPQLNVQELGQEQQLTLHEHETQEAFSTGSDDRGMKSAGDGTIVERRTPQLNVQELGQEQQLTLDEHETQEAFGTGSDDRGMKSAGGGIVVGRRGALQLEVQELELEQQPAPSLELRKEVQEKPPDPKQGIREAPTDPAEDTQEAPPDPAKETRGAPSDREDEAQGTPSYPEKETLEAPSHPEEETLEAPSDPDEKTICAAELADGPRDLEGPVVPASRKRTIGGNLPPNNLKAHVEPAGARRRGRRSTAKFSADERGRQRGECVDVRRRGHDVFFSEESRATGPDSEGHVTGARNRQKTMNALEMEEWRKVRRKKWKVARPNDKLVVRARIIYKRKMKDGEVEKYRCRLAA